MSRDRRIRRQPRVRCSNQAGHHRAAHDRARDSRHAGSLRLDPPHAAATRRGPLPGWTLRAQSSPAMAGAPRRVRGQWSRVPMARTGPR